MSTTPPATSPDLPVVEVFGPTVQGEGPDAGTPVHFIRFGGCEYRCSWCDSMYAVDPVHRPEWRRLTASALCQEVIALGGAPRLVVLSGGNPCLFSLDGLIRGLHSSAYRVAVETQGSVWRPWLVSADRLVVSPKPPSARQENYHHYRFMDKVMANPTLMTKTAVKIVILDEADLEWAVAYKQRYWEFPLYLSACTPPLYADATLPQVRASVGDAYAWLCEQVARRQELYNVHVLPQLHVVAWGTKRGV